MRPLTGSVTASGSWALRRAGSLVKKGLMLPISLQRLAKPGVAGRERQNDPALPVDEADGGQCRHEVGVGTDQQRRVCHGTGGVGDHHRAERNVGFLLLVGLVLAQTAAPVWLSAAAARLDRAVFETAEAHIDQRIVVRTQGIDVVGLVLRGIRLALDDRAEVAEDHDLVFGPDLADQFDNV